MSSLNIIIDNLVNDLNSIKEIYTNEITNPSIINILKLYLNKCLINMIDIYNYINSNVNFIDYISIHLNCTRININKLIYLIYYNYIVIIKFFNSNEINNLINWDEIDNGDLFKCDISQIPIEIFTNIDLLDETFNIKKFTIDISKITKAYNSCNIINLFNKILQNILNQIQKIISFMFNYQDHLEEINNINNDCVIDDLNKFCDNKNNQNIDELINQMKQDLEK